MCIFFSHPFCQPGSLARSLARGEERAELTTRNADEAAEGELEEGRILLSRSTPNEVSLAQLEGEEGRAECLWASARDD